MTPILRSTCVLMLLLIAGCTDQAEADFRRCEELEARGDFLEARRACKEARDKSPDSKYGKFAADRIPSLDRAIRLKKEAEGGEPPAE